MEKIPRILFNFNNTSLFGCEFCFIPFDNKGLGNISEWLEIFNRINDFNPDLLSFSGCDPLCYDDFYTLLLNVSKKCAFYIDTSLRKINKEKFDKVANKIDAISFSIDDSKNMIKNRQRYEPDIYMQIFENVRFIKNYNINLIAHTLVTPLNIDYIEDICKELISQDIKTLTLYQFRDYSFIKNREQYILTNNEFISVCTQIYNKYHDRLDIKYEVASERDEKYFFVSSKGIVYTTNGLNTLRHEYLGSIFDSDIAEKWNKYNDFNKCQLSTQEKINRECKNHGNKNY